MRSDPAAEQRAGVGRPGPGTGRARRPLPAGAAGRRRRPCTGVRRVRLGAAGRSCRRGPQRIDQRRHRLGARRCCGTGRGTPGRCRPTCGRRRQARRRRHRSRSGPRCRARTRCGGAAGLRWRRQPPRSRFAGAAARHVVAADQHAIDLAGAARAAAAVVEDRRIGAGRARETPRRRASAGCVSASPISRPAPVGPEEMRDVEFALGRLAAEPVGELAGVGAW